MSKHISYLIYYVKLNKRFIYVCNTSVAGYNVYDFKPKRRLCQVATFSITKVKTTNNRIRRVSFMELPCTNNNSLQVLYFYCQTIILYIHMYKEIDCPSAYYVLLTLFNISSKPILFRT